MNRPDAPSPVLAIVVNGESAVEYDRRVVLPSHQVAYLEAMDRRMEQGIRVGRDFLAAPDRLQCAQFVALQLWGAVRDGNDARTAAARAWLANRIPPLRQVRIEVTESLPHIDLVFDRDYVKEVRVDFSAPGKPSGDR